MVLAMAYYRLNQADAARAALAKGDELRRLRLPSPEAADLGSDWQNWAFALALRGEAENLLQNHQ
jgi:hypothetical protein